jgi:hypothetical protein
MQDQAASLGRALDRVPVLQIDKLEGCFGWKLPWKRNHIGRPQPPAQSCEAGREQAADGS